MQLNLLAHSPEMQESLVVHEFGHALGLHHEHQRSDFWKVIGQYIDMDKMMNDPLVKSGLRFSEDGKAGLDTNWLPTEEVTDGISPVFEYDPMSIMHYW